MANLIRPHQPCEDCGSHDAKSYYDDGSSYCFSCNKFRKASGEVSIITEEEFEKKLLESIEKGKFRDIPDRGITKATCERYGVRTIQKNGIIVEHKYPYQDAKGNRVATKTRVCSTKEFYSEGNMKGCALFGQALFPSSGKYISITEGEVDCLSVYQMFGGMYPVVSIPNGATSKRSIEDNYEYICGFDNIVLIWDADKAGQRAVKEIAQMLPPEKVKIVKLEPTMKDPNEYLKAGKVQEFISRWWRAEEYRPDDLVNIGDMFDRVKDYRKTHSYIATPWAGLNDMIAGTRAGQLVILAAGSGQGKSAFLRTWMDHLVKTTETHIGALYMEEKPEETVISLMSLRAGRNLKKPEVWDLTNEEELKQFFEDCGANRRIELFDPLMSASPEYILEKIRYMYQARKCSIIFLDHLTYLVDDSDDVRRDLNKLCKGLHDLCVSLGITVIAACHLRKAADARHSHEEGGRVTLDDLKDSSSVKQLSDVVIGLERDSQADNPVVANTTTLRVLKSRDFGQKGVACGCTYDKDTTRLTEIDTESLIALLGGDDLI